MNSVNKLSYKMSKHALVEFSVISHGKKVL